MTVKYGMKTIIRYIDIMLHLHSKSPTKEIKRFWKIFAFSGTFIIILNLVSGVPFVFDIKIPFPNSEILNYYGSFIFVVFIIIFCVIFMNTKKLLKIKT